MMSMSLDVSRPLWRIAATKYSAMIFTISSRVIDSSGRRNGATDATCLFMRNPLRENVGVAPVALEAVQGLSRQFSIFVLAIDDVLSELALGVIANHLRRAHV